MEILFVLVPLSIALITLAVYIFRWAVKSGQYDDLQGPAHSILFDDDEHLIPKNDLSTNDKIQNDTAQSGTVQNATTQSDKKTQVASSRIAKVK